MRSTGACLLYKFARVVIGENQTFVGGEEYLKQRGVEVVVLGNQECEDLMTEVSDAIVSCHYLMLMYAVVHSAKAGSLVRDAWYSKPVSSVLLHLTLY